MHILYQYAHSETVNPRALREEAVQVSGQASGLKTCFEEDNDPQNSTHSSRRALGFTMIPQEERHGSHQTLFDHFLDSAANRDVWRLLLTASPGAQGGTHALSRDVFSGRPCACWRLITAVLALYQYLGRTSSSVLVRWIACTAVVVGLLAIAGGFFLHMARGEKARGSAGVLVTNLGAGLLALATLFLAYLIIAA